MRKYWIYGALMMMGCQLLAGGAVNIPDPALKQRLLDLYDQNTDGEISQDEAQGATGALDCSSLGIADLTGIEAFTNISQLFCQQNALTTLPDLSGLSVLTSLNVNGNNLSALPDLSPSLQYLDCSNNQLTALPALAPMVDMHRIDCSYNQLTELPVLLTMFDLTTLICNNNQLTSLPSLETLSQLDSLQVQSNQLTGLPDLSFHPVLTDLDFSDNQISDFPDLSGNPLIAFVTANGNWFSSDDCTNIETALNLATGLVFNPQKDGEILSCAVNIPDNILRARLIALYDNNGDGEVGLLEAASVTGTLNVSGLGISDLTGVESFTGISDLICSDNNLTGLPNLSSISNLTGLNCANNRITDLGDFSGLTGLISLDCKDNKLIGLPDFTGFNSLGYLTCSNNRLLTLPDLNLPNLHLLVCSENLLDQLPPLGPNIQYLYASGNRIALLPDMSANTQLMEVDLSENNLTEASTLRHLTSMTFCNLGQNQLAQFPDLSATVCVDLFADNNPLTNPDAIFAGVPATVQVLSLNQVGLQNPPDLSPFTQLRDLRFAENLLTQVPDISPLINLEILRIPDNLLNDLPPLPDLVNLRVLEFQGNSIFGLPSFTNLPGLRSVNFSYSDIGVPTITATPLLEEIILCGNGHTTLPNIENFPNLTLLDMNRNSLSQIGDLSGLTQLRVLALAENNLTDLPGVAGLPALEELYINDNLLTHLEPQIPVNRDALRVLHCEGNQFSEIQDCDLIAILESSGMSSFIYNPQEDGSNLACQNSITLPDGYAYWMGYVLQGRFCGRPSPNIQPYIRWLTSNGCNEF